MGVRTSGLGLDRRCMISSPASASPGPARCSRWCSIPTERPYAIWRLIAPEGARGMRSMEGSIAVTREAQADVEAQHAPDQHADDWYKDAIVYQLHVKAFLDSSGDGIGDFKGLMQTLDYVESLGVNVHLAAAVLSVAAQGRRLRHLRLSPHQSVLWRHGRLQGLHGGGSSPRHSRPHRARHQSHLG